MHRYIGVDEVIEGYRKKSTKDCPFFSMWDKGAPICMYNGDDIEEGCDIIRDEIERNIKRGYNNECVLLIHTKKEKTYTKKSETIASIYFISFQKEEKLEKTNDFNSYLISKISALEEKLKDKDDEEEEEEDENIGQVADDWLTKIDKLLEKPVIAALIQNLLPKKNNIALAGIGEPITNEVEQEKLAVAITTLLNKGVKVDHFVKLSQMSETKLKSLLLML